VSGDEGADGGSAITACQGALVAFADRDITASTALLAHVVQQGGAQPGASLKLSKETTS
jgi:hypothetical protein